MILQWIYGVLLIAFASDTVYSQKIGLLYENNNPGMELIFRKAIEDAQIKYPQLAFEGLPVSVTNGNAFDVSRKLCNILRSSVVAVFGPLSTIPAEHAMSICDAKEMPYIDTRLDFSTQLPTINLHPHPAQLAVALKDLVLAFGFNGFTILYETGENLLLVNEILKLYQSNGPTVTVRRYELELNGNYRNVLKRVKKSNERNFVVVGSKETLPEFLKQSQQVGLMTSGYQYIIANLDLQTIDIEPYQHGDANITSFRLFSEENPQVVELMKVLESAENVSCPITISMGLMYDGVQLLAETLVNFDYTGMSLDCHDDQTWDKGYTLVNFMKSLSISGLTGEIKFDLQGLRTDFELEIIELNTLGLVKVGTWKPSDGYQVNRKPSPSLSGDFRSLANQSFVVITALSDPYGMLKVSSVKLEGNAQYEGFGIELIEELGKMLGFNYTFVLQEDGAYGSLNQTTGQWSGMMREILDGRADLGITDLTMTSDRESAVDFTIPFMNLGIAILYRKPTKEAPKLFSFMSPFSGEVWLLLGIAYISVSMSLFILGRMSPTEWDNPYPCIEEPTELENQFSFANSLWFTMGALLQQGSEIGPKAPSTRAVASIWWFFTLILVSSYTANLAAFLTVESLSPSIESAEDLAAGKDGVKYGAKIGGSTFNFFKDAKYPAYQKMYEFMRDNPQYMLSTNAEGVSKVENEKYAFLMESTTIEYITERHCTLSQVGSLLDEKGYGIAMRKNWPYRNALSQAVLELQEQGILTKMKTKWWKEKRGGGACSDKGGDGGATPLEISNLGGVYLVLIVGSCFAILVAFLELVIGVSSRSSENKKSFKTELLEEIKFVLQCSGNTKEIKYPKTSHSRSSIRTINSLDSIDTAHLDESKLQQTFDSIKSTKNHLITKE